MAFLRKYGFWIGIGLVCIAALVFQLVVVRPMAAKNAEMMGDLKARRQKLERAARDKHLKNEAWIKLEEARAKVWAEQKALCEKFFGSHKPFQDSMVDHKGRTITGRQKWVRAFGNQAQELVKKVRDRGIKIGDQTFQFQEQAKMYKEEFPSSFELKAATRNMFVQAELIDALCQEKIGLAAIVRLDTGSEAKDALKGVAELRHEGLYNTQTYRLTVWIKFERILYLFRELLRSKRLMLSIERIVIDGLEASDLQQANLVKLEIVGRFMDFVGAKPSS